MGAHDAPFTRAEGIDAGLSVSMLCLWVRQPTRTAAPAYPDGRASLPGQPGQPTRTAAPAYQDAHASLPGRSR